MLRPTWCSRWRIGPQERLSAATQGLLLRIQSTCRLYSQAEWTLLFGRGSKNRSKVFQLVPCWHSAQNKAVDPQHNWGLASPPLKSHQEEAVKPRLHAASRFSTECPAKCSELEHGPELSRPSKSLQAAGVHHSKPSSTFCTCSAGS